MSNFVKIRGYYNGETNREDKELIINTDLIFVAERWYDKYRFWGSTTENYPHGIVVDHANAAIIFRKMGISL